MKKFRLKYRIILSDVACIFFNITYKKDFEI